MKNRVCDMGFWIGFYFSRGPFPPKKTHFVTRKSKPQPLYAIKVGDFFSLVVGFAGYETLLDRAGGLRNAADARLTECNCRVQAITSPHGRMSHERLDSL